MTYSELLPIIMRPWIDVNDISKLAGCGKNTAINIRKDIELLILNEGKKIPKCSKKLVPTRLVLKYLGLDEDYIIRMAKSQ